MLKRQRPASPSPSSDAPFPAADIIDISHPTHGAKRRRIFAPVLDGAQRGWAAPGVPTSDSYDQYDSEEEYEDEEDNERSLEVESSLHEKGAVGAIYKSTNNMLHDLHALRRQRMLSGTSMTNSDRHGQSSSPQYQPNDINEHAKPTIQPTPRSPRSEPDKAFDAGMNAVEMEVKQRYEDTNRCAWLICLNYVVRS